jgi:thiol-disulfide isomerase/thioredoxin
VSRRWAWIVGGVLLAAVLAVGLLQAGSGGGDEPESFDLAEARKSLRGAPAPLAALHEQSAALLDGGVRAFERRLKELEGRPVVINKWASWCGPCRAEFPVFQRVATERGREIAFLGVDGHDSREPAERFLAQYPVPFPSYVDPDEKISRRIRAPANYPITVFLDAQGETAFIKQGGYETADSLEADIDRYLGA